MDPLAFLQTYKGQTLNAIVEQVRDGGSLRVTLILSPSQNYQTATVMISGIKAPIVRSGIPGMEDLIEPFGYESKYFVESRLLGREIGVIVEGTANNALVASISFPAGNIAEALLSEGLAQVSDWTISTVTGGSVTALKLRNAEKRAKDSQIRIWKGKFFSFESN